MKKKERYVYYTYFLFNSVAPQTDRLCIKHTRLLSDEHLSLQIAEPIKMSECSLVNKTREI